ncbi:MAG TPA: 4-hydroxy-3-methylbut-2-enyl diphosphate reductase [candidate division Zixibacteria bacterium]|nr:4-hydroxy-3-methylbut-2-enyl diphosphate reductase [candidate division Zixibacteria bacterium]
MEVILSKEAGFCFGVERAIRMAMQSTEKEAGKVYTFGPIIHNPQVVEDFKKKGVEVIADPEDISAKGVVVIRAHGVKPTVESEIKQMGVEVVDGTCPIVKHSQKYAKKLYDEGYQVVVIGERHHPEVIGLLGYTNETAIVIDPDVTEVQIPPGKKLGVIPQTTLEVKDFLRVVGLLIEKAREVRVFNNVCNAVTDIQEATKELSQEVDMVLVIGGKNSANTSRLAVICRALGKSAHHIETPEEIQKDWFYGMKRVGVTAGTSTPDWIIKAVMERAQKLGEEAEREVIAANS